MSTAFFIWLAAAGIVALAWLTRYAATFRILHRRHVLSPRSYPPGPPPVAPRISIIVAARNEEPHIETCVRGLLDQDYPDFEVVVVDDRSTDATPHILAQMAKQAGGRLRVVRVAEVRKGWFGKNNAMREGVAIATGEWLLFTDADCRQHSRRTLSSAMREALAYECDFLSVTPMLAVETVWERIIQPVCTLALMIWFLPHRVNKPKRKTAYANGAFMLLSRACYDAIGGHEPVRTEVNEDIHLARRAKRQGFRLRVVENEGLYSTRMYDSLAGAWHGWSRIFYGSLGTLPKLCVAATLIATLTLLPWASLIAGLVGWSLADAPSANGWTVAVGIWAGAVLLVQAVIWRVYGILKAGRLWSVTYPLGSLVVLGMQLNAMLKVIGATRTTWRGTTYRKDQVETPTAVTPTESDAAATGDPAGTAPAVEPQESPTHA